MEPSLAIDSVVLYYTYEEFINFSDYTAKDFAKNVENYRNQYGHTKITDRDTIRMLYQKVKALKPAIDSLQPDIDTRIMGIFHKTPKNDSIYFSALRGHAIQLNHLTMQSDSCLWVFVRDAICERDTAYSNRFSNSRGLYFGNR